MWLLTNSVRSPRGICEKSCFENFFKFHPFSGKIALKQFLNIFTVM